DLIDMKPWLIKPNQEEISAYLGREIDGFDELFSVAKDLHEQGIENVMISLGAQGALLVCSEGTFVARPPKVDALSTIGAGDSSIAGFVSVADKPASTRLRTAVAFGTAACLTPGTRPPRPEDVASILDRITVE
ncbi:MAG: 1-phosphofructokinase family hexose kinase, partial [Clostridia bacterium]|nr:1-phosphofructokinase family hexose kinase [Clostridia bacterium]